MKPTVCKYCSKVNIHYSFQCSLKPKKEVGDIEEMSFEEYKAKINKYTPVKRTSIKKTYKSTGEHKLFLQIFSERNGVCQITGEQLQFDVWCFAHVLSKGAYPSLRLYKENIIMCKREIHDLYDNSSKEELLAKYPKAILFYELKDKLRHEYYNK